MFPALSPKNTALLIIDMSLDFLQVGAPFETVEGRDMLPNLVRFVHHCRAVSRYPGRQGRARRHGGRQHLAGDYPATR